MPRHMHMHMHMHMLPPARTPSTRRTTPRPPWQAGKFQKIENLNISLKYINSFMVSIGIKATYSAEDIYEGNITFILGMIW